MHLPSAQHAKILVRLGIATARLQANPDAEEYEIARESAAELGFSLPPFGPKLPALPDEAWFAGPSGPARRAFHRIGLLTFALFMLAPEGHEGAAAELRELFEALGFAKAGLSRYVDELATEDPEATFRTFAATIDSLIDAGLGKRGELTAPIITALDELEAFAAKHASLRAYFDDLCDTLAELKTCVAHECPIASLSLSGKLMELGLKLILRSRRVPFAESAGMSALLVELRAKCPAVQLDSSMPEIAKLIDEARIPCIDERVKPPKPTTEQVASAILASADLLTAAIKMAHGS
jgi:hypothetical protein